MRLQGLKSLESGRVDGPAEGKSNREMWRGAEYRGFLRDAARERPQNFALRYFLERAERDSSKGGRAMPRSVMMAVM